jgi:hypothetical protein
MVCKLMEKGAVPVGKKKRKNNLVTQLNGGY